MHAMLAPDLLCRVLVGDGRLSRDAQRTLQKARALSVPAIGIAQLTDWQLQGRLHGDIGEILSLLRDKGVQIAPLGHDTLQMLANQGWEGSSLSLHDRLAMATAISANAILLTEHQPLAQLAPANSLWLPPLSSSEGDIQ